MKVIYFTRDYSPHDDRFLTALGQTDHKIFLLRLEGSRWNSQQALPRNINEIEWIGGSRPQNCTDSPGLLVDLRRVIEDIQPDLIHAGPIQRVASLAAQSCFEPLVSMSWGSDLLNEADSSDEMKRLTKSTLQKTTVLLCDCETVSRKAQGFGFPTERIVQFPWGVDLEHFSPGEGEKLRRQFGWQSNFVILSVRAWEPLYGVDVIVRGFALALKKNSNLRLLLLGSGSQENEIKELIKTKRLEDYVKLGGSVGLKDLPEVYRTADLYVSASHTDGSSVSLLEALACGKPVLVSDIPGNLEWIQNSQNGWTFPDGDVDQLSNQILQISVRNDLEKFGKSARRLAELRADWKVNFKKLLSAYDLAEEIASRKK